jgi:hypothetical protein
MTREKRRKELNKALDIALNACIVRTVRTVDDEFTIEVDLDNAGNAFDSGSLQGLLKRLKELGLVKRGVQTMWFGLNNYHPITNAKFKIWCSVGN